MADNQSNDRGSVVVTGTSTGIGDATVSRLTSLGINLRQQRKLGEKDGGRFIDETHFVVAGGQVKPMLSWLGYMKHGEPQQRVMGVRMPPPNLKPDFVEQARSFVDGVVDKALGQAVDASAASSTTADPEGVSASSSS